MMIKMVDNTAEDDGNDGADRGDTDVDADADDHENMDNDTTEHDDADNNDANDDTMTEGYNMLCQYTPATATSCNTGQE